jgi:hypothetical protein
VNVHRAKKPTSEPLNIAAAANLLLAAGGDERILPDPVTRRNRYGTMVTPSSGEIFLSSSTASTITPRAHQAVEMAWAALSADRGGAYPRIDAWFDSLRTRLLDLFGVAGSSVVLTGSGTEAELTALAIARSILGGPLTNIVMAPGETGSGVPRAAGGAHFLASTPFGEIQTQGHPLNGWANADIEVAKIEIRDSRGRLRSADDIDAEARLRADAAIQAGRNVLLHLLQASKTGRSGLTVAEASEILAGAPDRVIIVADCCQLRCSREHIQRLLRLGFMVAITGSKFFAGPPFSGALLLPPRILARIGQLALPAGLADYSSRLDWPGDLQAKIRLPWANDANLGLGLRWVAALSEMERFFAAPSDLRFRILTYFERAVRRRAERLESLREIADDLDPLREEPSGILPFIMVHPDGEPFSAGETGAIHARLRSSRTHLSGDDLCFREIFHLGQPVAVGAETALRVCASAPMISEIAARVAEGESLDVAFAQWGCNLDALFEKWQWLMSEIFAERLAAPPVSADPRRNL